MRLPIRLRWAPIPALLGLIFVGCRGPAPASAARRTAPAPELAALDPLDDARAEVRRGAVTALARSREPWAVRTLITCLDDAEASVREAAVQALLSLGTSAIPALVRALDLADEARLPRIRDVLLRFGGAAAPALLEAARGATSRVAVSRLEAVLVALGPAALPALKAVIDRRDQEVDTLAVFVLTELKDPSVVLLLLRALKVNAEESRRRNTVDSMRPYLIDWLSRHLDATGVTHVLAALRDEPSGQTATLLELLGEARDPRIAPALIALLTRTTLLEGRRYLLDLALRREGAHRLAIAALAAEDPGLRTAMLETLASELTSLGRQVNVEWAQAERARFRDAYRAERARVDPVLEGFTRGPDPERAHAAARLRFHFGGIGSLAPADAAYLAALGRDLGSVKAPAPDRAMALHGRIGALHWERSCPTPRPDGLCARTRTVAPKGAPTQVVRELVRRDPGRVRLAAHHAAEAWRLWASGKVTAAIPPGPEREARVAWAQYWASWARFMQAEVRLEAHLGIAVRMPRGKPAAPGGKLDFMEATRTLTGALKPWTDPLEALVKRYHEEQASRWSDPGTGSRETYWDLAGRWRAGVLRVEHLRRLSELPTPVHLVRPEARKVWADAVAGQVYRLEHQASSIFTSCAFEARNDPFGEVARHCEAGVQAYPPVQGNSFFDRSNRLTRAPLPRIERRTLDSAEIRHGVRRQAEAVWQCYRPGFYHDQGHYQRLLTEARRLVVSLRIETTGRLTVLQVTGPGQPEIQSCVKKALEDRVRFPAAPPSPMEIRYPYEPEPGGPRPHF